MIKKSILVFLVFILTACGVKQIQNLKIIKLHSPEANSSDLIRIIVINNDSLKYKLTKLDSETLLDTSGSYPSYQIIDQTNLTPVIEYKSADYTAEGRSISESRGTIYKTLKKGHCYLLNKRPAVKAKFIETATLETIGLLNGKECKEKLQLLSE